MARTIVQVVVELIMSLNLIEEVPAFFAALGKDKAFKPALQYVEKTKRHYVSVSVTQKNGLTIEEPTWVRVGSNPFAPFRIHVSASMESDLQDQYRNMTNMLNSRWMKHLETSGIVITGKSS